jgi:hypothetical protein
VSIIIIIIVVVIICVDYTFFPLKFDKSNFNVSQAAMFIPVDLQTISHSYFFGTFIISLRTRFSIDSFYRCETEAQNVSHVRYLVLHCNLQ